MAEFNLGESRFDVPCHNRGTIMALHIYIKMSDYGGEDVTFLTGSEWSRLSR